MDEHIASRIAFDCAQSCVEFARSFSKNRSVVDSTQGRHGWLDAEASTDEASHIASC